jgi:hypothetical protein
MTSNAHAAIQGLGAALFWVNLCSYLHHSDRLVGGTYTSMHTRTHTHIPHARIATPYVVPLVVAPTTAAAGCGTAWHGSTP